MKKITFLFCLFIIQITFAQTEKTFHLHNRFLSEWASETSSYNKTPVSKATSGEPVYTDVQIVPDCEGDFPGFNISLNFISLGNGTPYISNGNNTWPVTATGLMSVGPFASGSSVTLVLQYGFTGTLLGSFTYECTASLKNLDKTHLKVYPNPAADITTVSYDKIIESVEVYNINGRKIKTIAVQSKEARINLSNMASGNYILTIVSGAQKGHVSLLKK